jgi:nicotinamidase/pyrazinamidase
MQIGPRDVLIVVDVQNDFCPGGALAVAEANAILPVLHRIAPRFQHIVLTQDWHPASHSSFAASHPDHKPFDEVDCSYGRQTLWPTHCVQGTPGAEFHPELNLTGAELILRKGLNPAIDSYSAFFENDQKTPTGLAGYLNERRFQRAFFAGLAYDFCVGFSALDATDMGFEAIVLRDACRSINLNGSVERMEAQFAQAGVVVMETGQLDGGKPAA